MVCIFVFKLFVFLRDQERNYTNPYAFDVFRICWKKKSRIFECLLHDQKVQIFKKFSFNTSLWKTLKTVYAHMFIVQINAEKERLKNIFEQEKMALQKQQDREIEELKRKHAQRKETVQEQLQELVLAFVCDSLFCQIRSHCADHNILS